MKSGGKKILTVLLAGAVLFTGMPETALAQNQEMIPEQNQKNVSHEIGRSSGVSVATDKEFLSALENRQSPIVVTRDFVISEEAEANGRMRPIKIPAGTLIQGTEGASISTRNPIQIEGDGVVFQNIKLTFTSSDALGSVPHREIFLAGHSLTLDNVKTYLEGSDGSQGPLGGTEKELLPSVYAGGYPGTVNGSNAALTVKNSNSETMFQAIYLGHGAGTEGNVSYTGNAQLNLDGMAIVRDYVDASQNSRASICLTGAGIEEYGKTVKFLGNQETTLTLCRLSLRNAETEGIGSLVMDEACLSVASTINSLGNVTLQNGGCLDLNSGIDTLIKGNFTGVSDPEEQRGILVLNKSGILSIQGQVSGTTQFQSGLRVLPQTFLAGRTYITADPAKAVRSNFAVAERIIENGQQLNYRDGAWTACWLKDYEEPPEEEKPPVVTPPEEEKPPVVTPPEEEKPQPPVHVHTYMLTVRKATTKRDGLRIKKCSCGKIAEQKVIPRIHKISLSGSRILYNGKSQKPAVTIVDRTGRKIGSGQYQLSYQNNVQVGQAAVILSFRGDYSGTWKKTFTIVPKKTSITGLSAKSKGFLVKWKRQSSQTTGYEIQYSTNSKFSKKYTKAFTVKNNRTVSKKISRQKAKKKYYIRIRTYKTVKVNGKPMKIYSDWSKVKTVKTKK
ncbi:MAG: hypothetical protein HFH41_09055 [Lachnospiraceae bacterium]|nr:hypothetical protein [Lachnospiraceae bacterium]